MEVDTINYNFEAILNALLGRVKHVPDDIVFALLDMHEEVGNKVSSEMQEHLEMRGLKRD